MVRINKIIHDSIVDGPGIRSVIFTQGCYHMCEGCHNEETLSISDGILMDIAEIITEVENNNFTKKVTISGGDPLIQDDIICLVKEFKALEYHVMLYTGYTIEEVKNSDKNEILEYLDILVDGKFDITKRDISLQYCGSTNQNIHILN